MASTGIRGLTGLGGPYSKNPPPIKTPMYPSVQDPMSWTWAKYFDDLTLNAGDTTGGGGHGGSGTQGVTGLRGIQGADGVDGKQGVTGILGIDGQTGIQGDTGIAGQTGIQGDTGIAGIGNFIQDPLFPQPIIDPSFLWNQTDEALYVGVTGVSDWVQIGTSGEKGDQGATGMGIQGVTGLMGPTGIQGDTGIQGVGFTGLQGLANWIEDPNFPDPIVTEPILLWNQTTEALFCGVTGISHWVQISGNGSQGLTGLRGPGGGDQGHTGLQGVTGFEGLANFIEDPLYPPIITEPIFLWNTTDEALFAGITGINHWVQISAGSEKGDQGLQGVTGLYVQGVTGFYGQTGLQGDTGIKGLANWVEDASFPVIVDEPIFLWNTVDEALYAGITGIDHWVQISAGAERGDSGVTGLHGRTGIQGPTGIRGLTGLNGLTGIQGQTGFRGPIGLLGNTGNTGIQGQTGIMGVTGIRGSCRTTSVASGSSLTPNSNTTDLYTITALAETCTINNPSGSPVDGQVLNIRIKDNGSARALFWGAAYRAVGVTLPGVTVALKTMYLGNIYNSTASKWDVIAKVQE